MKILKRILLVLAILLLVITAIGLVLPSHVHVERSTVIQKPREMVFAYVNDLRNWNTWSPWYELDTTATYSHEGPPVGKGAKISWISADKNVGTGSITISEVSEPLSIEQKLNFMEEGTATANFRFEEEGAATKMTWGFDFDTGFNPLLRILGKFMDGMVGKDFEKGLAGLKNILENRNDVPAGSGPVQEEIQPDSLTQQ